jgi:hypothetical protein
MVSEGDHRGPPAPASLTVPRRYQTRRVNTLRDLDVALGPDFHRIPGVSQVRHGQPLLHIQTGHPGAFLTFQLDGNLVLYRADGFALTWTGTNGTAADRFVVEDDSDLMIYGVNDEIYWRRL